MQHEPQPVSSAFTSLLLSWLTQRSQQHSLALALRASPVAWSFATRYLAEEKAINSRTGALRTTVFALRKLLPLNQLLHCQEAEAEPGTTWRSESRSWDQLGCVSAGVKVIVSLSPQTLAFVPRFLFLQTMFPKYGCRINNTHAGERERKQYNYFNCSDQHYLSQANRHKVQTGQDTKQWHASHGGWA